MAEKLNKSQFEAAWGKSGKLQTADGKKILVNDEVVYILGGDDKEPSCYNVKEVSSQVDGTIVLDCGKVKFRVPKKATAGAAKPTLAQRKNAIMADLESLKGRLDAVVEILKADIEKFYDDAEPREQMDADIEKRTTFIEKNLVKVKLNDSNRKAAILEKLAIFEDAKAKVDRLVEQMNDKDVKKTATFCSATEAEIAEIKRGVEMKYYAGVVNEEKGTSLLDELTPDKEVVEAHALRKSFADKRAELASRREAIVAKLDDMDARGETDVEPKFGGSRGKLVYATARTDNTYLLGKDKTASQIVFGDDVHGIRVVTPDHEVVKVDAYKAIKTGKVVKYEFYTKTETGYKRIDEATFATGKVVVGYEYYTKTEKGEESIDEQTYLDKKGVAPVRKVEKTLPVVEGKDAVELVKRIEDTIPVLPASGKTEPKANNISRDDAVAGLIAEIEEIEKEEAALAEQENSSETFLVYATARTDNTFLLGGDKTASEIFFGDDVYGIRVMTPDHKVAKVDAYKAIKTGKVVKYEFYTKTETGYKRIDEATFSTGDVKGKKGVELVKRIEKTIPVLPAREKTEPKEKKYNIPKVELVEVVAVLDDKQKAAFVTKVTATAEGTDFLKATVALAEGKETPNKMQDYAVNEETYKIVLQQIEEVKNSAIDAIDKTIFDKDQEIQKIQAKINESARNAAKGGKLNKKEHDARNARIAELQKEREKLEERKNSIEESFKKRFKTIYSQANVSFFKKPSNKPVEPKGEPEEPKEEEVETEEGDPVMTEEERAFFEKYGFDFDEEFEKLAGEEEEVDLSSMSVEEKKAYLEKQGEKLREHMRRMEAGEDYAYVDDEGRRILFKDGERYVSGVDKDGKVTYAKDEPAAETEAVEEVEKTAEPEETEETEKAEEPEVSEVEPEVVEEAEVPDEIITEEGYKKRYGISREQANKYNNKYKGI